MREFLASYAKVEFDKVKQRIAAYLQTPVGVEHLGAMVPSTHRDTITEELLFTSEMKRLIGEVNPVPLNSFPDLRVTLQRASIIEYVLSATDLLAIGRLASNVREIKSFFSGKSGEFPKLCDLASGLHVDKVLEYNISRAIDDEGMVCDTASRELQVIRRALRRRGEMLRNKMESILSSLQKKGVTQEDLITTRDGRLVIPV
ncbi:MAG TPA: hypothetical protein VLA34_01015, partial [Candidatus Krumholzibacterium sp.]|nr:hypothetical protein [Candidatus Krumholzibacterium sp.]